MSIPSIGPGHGEPLVVTPKVAQFLLNVGHTRLYELISAGELETYREGRSRRVTMASIRARIARKLAEERSPINLQGSEV